MALEMALSDTFRHTQTNTATSKKGALNKNLSHPSNFSLYQKRRKIKGKEERFNVAKKPQPDGGLADDEIVLGL